MRLNCVFYLFSFKTALNCELSSSLVFKKNYPWKARRSWRYCYGVANKKRTYSRPWSSCNASSICRFFPMEVVYRRGTIYMITQRRPSTQCYLLRCVSSLVIVTWQNICKLVFAALTCSIWFFCRQKRTQQKGPPSWTRDDNLGFQNGNKGFKGILRLNITL